jgi:Lipocalin-like domain
MKTLILALLCLTTFSSMKGQDKNLVGTWNLTSWANVSDAGTTKMTEDQLKADNQSTLYIFLEDGKFKVTSNMAGSGTMDSYDGTWKTSENKVVITLKIGEQTADLDNTYELKNDTLILTRVSPDNSLKIINTFRKKE